MSSLLYHHSPLTGNIQPSLLWMPCVLSSWVSCLQLWSGSYQLHASFIEHERWCISHYQRHSMFCSCRWNSQQWSKEKRPQSLELSGSVQCHSKRANLDTQWPWSSPTILSAFLLRQETLSCFHGWLSVPISWEGSCWLRCSLAKMLRILLPVFWL